MWESERGPFTIRASLVQKATQQGGQGLMNVGGVSARNQAIARTSII